MSGAHPKGLLIVCRYMDYMKLSGLFFVVAVAILDLTPTPSSGPKHEHIQCDEK